MAEYIEREALLRSWNNALKNMEPEEDGMHAVSFETVLFYVKHFPAADVVEVVPELRKAVELLHKEYEKVKRLDFVHDPLAYAVYLVWEAVDRQHKNGR